MKIFISIIILLNVNFIFAQDLDYVSHEPHSINGDDFAQIFSLGEDGEGTIYAGSQNSMIYKYKDDEWTSFTIPNSNNKIQEITGDGFGNLYVAVFNEGLWVYKEDNWKLFDNSNSSYPLNPEHGGIAWDFDTQVLWIGTNNGLVKYADDSIVVYNYSTVGVDMIDDEIWDLVLDTDGSIWMISNLSTLIHLENNTFNSLAVGWNLEIYDLVLKEIGLKTNGDITISTNYGLMSYNRNDFEFIEEINYDLNYLDVDQFDNIWVTDKNLLWKYSTDTLITYRDPLIPDFLYSIFVSSDNHIWLAGENGAIIEIIQESTNYIFPNDYDRINVIIFPNPIIESDFINLYTQSPEFIETISVFNTFSQKVYTSKFKKKINIKLDKGLYFIIIKTKYYFINKSLIVR